MPLTSSFTGMFDLEHPLALAPMDVVAGGHLAGEVSRAGGLGLIGGGYGEEQWLRREFARAEGARVGCGFITWSLAERPALLDVALEHEPVAVMLSFGDPAPFVDRIRDAGARVLCQVHTLAQAREALAAGADVVVAQGSEAGGHGRAERTAFTLVPEVADLIAEEAPGTPLLAAGGVVDGRAVAAALVLGADGVLVGTRLLATAEALLPAGAQRRVLGSSGDDTVRTGVYDVVRRLSWPREYTSRVLRNGFVERWHGREDELAADLPRVVEQYRAAVDGDDPDEVGIIAGEAIGRVDRVRPAAEVVRALGEQAVRRLGASWRRERGDAVAERDEGRAK
ncbi:nitronate monooxygenase family protein [Salinifilum aidingensis]